MNYRHFYHAGNFADVFKHALLVAVIESLKQKNKPFSYIDTHAGIGDYDLRREETQRSKEYSEGIKKLLTSKSIAPELNVFCALIKAYQKKFPHHYPGSPMLAKELLREGDQMMLNELHPDDFQVLKLNVGKSAAIHCHHRDAYEFLPAILPPKPARGCILIDAPFEKREEFGAIIDCLKKSIPRFQNGIYMVWYPIVSLQHRQFTRQILREKFGPKLVSEICLTAIPEQKSGLIGCGMIIINPPWQIEKTIAPIAQALTQLFQRDESAYSRTDFQA